MHPNNNVAQLPPNASFKTDVSFVCLYATCCGDRLPKATTHCSRYVND